MINTFVDKALVCLPKMMTKLPFAAKCALPGGLAKREVKEEFNQYIANELVVRGLSNVIGLSGTTVGESGRFKMVPDATVIRTANEDKKLWCVHLHLQPRNTGITLDYAMGFAKSSLPSGDDRVNQGIPAVLAISKTEGTETSTEFGALCVSGQFEATAIPVPESIAKKAQMAEFGPKAATALAVAMVGTALIAADQAK